MGTGNAFAREFGLSANNWRQAVERFSPKRLQRIDVGQVCWAGGEFYFLNVIGLGYAADAGLAAHKVKFVGRSAYTLGALWRLLRLRTYPLEMALDGDPIQQDNVFVEISNSRYTGTSFLMAPDAQLDDGLLDVTWLRRVHRARLSCLFRSIFRGRHIMHPEVETRQVREVELRAPQGSQLMCDGEFHGRTPATVRCRHRDLEWLG
jgi:diacylglycerol kinase (ATP)